MSTPSPHLDRPNPRLEREARRRLAVIRHVEEVTGNVALTCRYFGISRQAYYIWYRRYAAEGIDGLRTGSKRPKTCPHATRAEVVAPPQSLVCYVGHRTGPVSLPLCMSASGTTSP